MKLKYEVVIITTNDEQVKTISFSKFVYIEAKFITRFVYGSNMT